MEVAMTIDQVKKETSDDSSSIASGGLSLLKEMSQNSFETQQTPDRASGQKERTTAFTNVSQEQSKNGAFMSKYKMAMTAIKTVTTFRKDSNRLGQRPDNSNNSQTTSYTAPSSINRASVSSISRQSVNYQSPNSNENTEGGMYDNDPFRKFSFSGIYLSNEIQVTVKYKDQAYNIKLSEDMTVSKAIIAIAISVQSSSTSSSSNFKTDILDPDQFYLGKRERQNPNMRKWFTGKAPLSMYALKQGDELIFKHKSDINTLMYVLPPEFVETELSFDHSLTVQDAIIDLKRKNGLGDTPYGFYNPQVGMWLDGMLNLVSYDFHNHILQFRALVNEFLIRISIPDFELKIGIKALPTFFISDVISIISYQLLNRNLILPTTGIYGLFLESKGRYLNESMLLEEVPTAQKETMIFKIQHQLCNIKVTPLQSVQMMVNYSCTAADVIGLFLVNHALSMDQEYALYGAGGSMIPMERKMMDHLKLQLPLESILIQMRPITIQLSCSNYPDVNIPFDVDTSKGLSCYLTSFLRKLGFSLQNFVALRLENKKNPILEMDISISKLKIVQSTRLFVEIKASTTSQEQKSIEMVLEKKARSANVSHTISLYSIEELINKLTDPAVEQSGEFMKRFLLTYQKFIKSEELVKMLVRKYTVENTSGMSWPEFQSYRKPIELKTTNVMLQWVKNFPYDFATARGKSETVLTALEFLDDIIENDNPAIAKQIRKNINRNHQVDIHFGAQFAKDKFIDDLTSNVIVFNSSAQEIADQLTIIESYLYCAITPPELLNQAWSKKDAITTAPNIIALSRRFNKVASWTVQAILDMKTPKHRAERISKIVEVAACLKQLNNYSSLMAIIAGMNKACITRLHETMKELQPKTLKKKAEMELMMSALGSYKNYRNSIHNIQPPCIPYIGTYLTDLTYIEDGNPDLIDGMINFSKCELISKVIREIIEYQQTPYTLKLNTEVSTILYNIAEANEIQEKVFWTLSKKYEQSAK